MSSAAPPLMSILVAGDADPSILLPSIRVNFAVSALNLSLELDISDEDEDEDDAPPPP